jgi:hypothetical protein
LGRSQKTSEVYAVRKTSRLPRQVSESIEASQKLERTNMFTAQLTLLSGKPEPTVPASLLILQRLKPPAEIQ